MTISQEDLAEIVARSATLLERLESWDPTGHEEPDGPLAKARLERWCEKAAEGDRTRFEKRLALDALDMDRVWAIFGTARAPKKRDRPVWAGLLTEGLAAVLGPAENDAQRPRFLDPEFPLPFEDLLLPFVQVAEQRVEATAAKAYEKLAEGARTSLARSLLEQLSYLSSQALGLKFMVFRAMSRSAMAFPALSSSEAPASEYYQAFVETFKSGEIVEFFREFPVLARLVGTAIELWIESTEELLQRLSADWEVIRETFQPDTDPTIVAAIHTSLSDPHDRGRTVVMLTFSSGLQLVYKPRNLRLDQLYGALLHWLNNNGAPLSFRALKVLNRETYGWIEYAQYQPCETPAQATHYYQRAGALLCLLYLLEATDFHFENLVASGQYPIPVDLETLLQHRPSSSAKSDPTGRSSRSAHDQMWDSVLRVGILPRWETNAKGQAYDTSGLGNTEIQAVSFRRSQWHAINTDQMEFSEVLTHVGPGANAAYLDERPLDPTEFVEDIVRGFRTTYEFLLAARPALLSSRGPLAPLARERVRFILRPTRVYALLLNRLLHPNYLGDGTLRSIELDVLSRALLEGDRPIYWPLLRVETEALERLDIPLFSAVADRTSLRVDGRHIIRGAFEESGYDRVISRLERLSEADLRRQIAFIRGALFSRRAKEAHKIAFEPFEATAPDPLLPLNRGELIQQAKHIANALDERAIRSDNGNAVWIAPTYLPAFERYQLLVTGYGLYGGGIGIGVFLAALEYVTGGAGLRDLALGAFAPLEDFLRQTEQHRWVAQGLGIGGADGLGSIVYALVKASDFLVMPDLLEQAGRVAALITSEMVTDDRCLDVMGGTAGTLLALLRLHERNRDKRILELAIRCGDHLVKHRTPGANGLQAWATVDDVCLTGFSHGSAGISYALLRLHEASEDTRFLEAAKEGIAFERSLFVPEAGNWPDLRRASDHSAQEARRFMTAWCHGAPGIALARLGGLLALDTPAVRQDIDVALQTTLAHDLRGPDHLCCGSLGRADILLTAASLLDRPDLLDSARRQTAQIVSRAGHRGTFVYSEQLPPDVYNPGLFQGSSGIAYALLRMAYPDRLPSILLWE